MENQIVDAVTLGGSAADLDFGTVETEDENLHDSKDVPSISLPLETPRASRIVGARSIFLLGFHRS